MAPPPSRVSLHHQLALDEVLRPTLRLRETFEPLTLPWYQEIERLRYHRHGRWIPRLLDFGKYHGERLLGLGSSLGSDLVNFAAQGVEVLVANPVAEQLALVRRNFDLRRLPGIFLHASPTALPIESASIDIVFINGLLHESDDSARVVEETYRVLRPGGKLVAIVSARQENNFLTKVMTLLHAAGRSATGTRWLVRSGRSLLRPSLPVPVAFTVSGRPNLSASSPPGRGAAPLPLAPLGDAGTVYGATCSFSRDSSR